VPALAELKRMQKESKGKWKREMGGGKGPRRGRDWANWGEKIICATNVLSEGGLRGTTVRKEKK